MADVSVGIKEDNNGRLRELSIDEIGPQRSRNKQKAFGEPKLVVHLNFSTNNGARDPIRIQTIGEHLSGSTASQIHSEKDPPAPKTRFRTGL